MKNKLYQGSIGKLIVTLLLSLFLSVSFFGLTNAPRNIGCFLIAFAVAFVSLWVLPDEWKKQSKRNQWILVLYGIVFSVTTLLGGLVVIENGDPYSGSYLDNYLVPMQWVDSFWMLGIAIFSISLLMLLSVLYNRLSLQDSTESQKFIPQWIMWLFIFVAWLPWVIAYYPGMLYGDSSYAIIDAMNGITNNNNPVCHILLIRLFLVIGKALHSYQFGCLLYTLFQMLVLSGVFAYALRWLQQRGCHKLYVFIVLLYFALTPFMPMHAVSMWKDPLYSASLLLLALKTADIVCSEAQILNKPKTVLLLFLYTLAVCFIRNNGILAMVMYWFLMFCVYGIGKHRAKGMLWKAGGLAALMVYFVVYGPVYQALNIYRPFKEMASVPLQQMARTVVYDGVVTEEQQAFLDGLMFVPIEEVYHPCCSDSMKSDLHMNVQYLNDNKGTFFRTWLSMTPKNLRLYGEAYLMQTFELYSIGDVMLNFTPTGGTVLINDERLAEYAIRVRDLSQEWFGTSWRKVLPMDSIFPSTGSLAWLYIGLMMLVLLERKDKKWLLVFCPMLCSWATLLLGTPLVEWRRYALPFHYALPLVLMVPLLGKHAEKSCIDQ
ncbi:MAG: hypothetical protein J6K73_03550 [Clostridia bacterium]|nr:hypothetical protein [Clostridia bacterium]MBP3648840.1 hypothetical protein [Clostridia bacterium]